MFQRFDRFDLSKSCFVLCLFDTSLLLCKYVLCYVCRENNENQNLSSFASPPPPSPQEKNLEMKACHTHISIIFYLALATLSKLSLCYYDFFVMFIFKFVNAYFLNFA